MPQRLARRAIAHWNQLLEEDGLALRTHDALMAAARERGLYYGDRPISTFLRPRFVEPDTWAQAARLGRSFHRGLQRVMHAIRDDPAMLAAAGIHGRLQELVRMPQRGADDLWFLRLDGFLDRHMVRLVEFNVDSPGGAAFVDGWADALQDTEIFRRFRRRFRLRRRPNLPTMRRCFTEALARHGGSSVAIVDWREVATVGEFEIIRDDLARHGVKAIVADPRDFRLKGGRAMVGDVAVDLVVKRVLVTDLAARGAETPVFLDAVRRGLVTCINPMACQAVTTKALLAMFGEGLLDHYLTPAMRALWRDHVPWTVRVRDGRVRRGDRTVDLLRHAARNRERLVLKPSDAYGAEGIVLGWHCDDAAWSRALDGALGGDFVLQERVAIPSEDFPDAEDGSLRYRRMHVEISPYTYLDGVTCELLSRLSASDFLNVKAGGGVVATYLVVDER